MMTLWDYFAALDKAVEVDGVTCAGCNADLHPGNMAAFGLLMPLGENNSTGIVSSFCEACAGKGRDYVTQSFIKGVAKETGVEMARLQ
jgi:hypothetical protein